MKILLLGGGGREHALAWKIAQSEKCEKLFIAPGNAGTQNVGENVNIKADDFEALKNFAVENGVDMVVVGPEDPLVKGVYDDFKADPRTQNIPVIGPSKAGAVLEGSKDFAKQFMKRHNIPTAQYETFDGEHVEEGLKFLETLKAPYVLKADGLCAGKGVLILPTLEEAKKEFKEMLGGMFGNASARVVIEEFLSGIECSVFVLTDGKNYKILPEAKDYKRIGEHDTAQEFLDYHAGRSIAKHTSEHLLELLLGLFESREDEYALACAQTVGLQYVRSLQGLQELQAFLYVLAVEGFVLGCRDVVALHKLLGEVLAAFQYGTSL